MPHPSRENLFPDLAAERARLGFARASRDGMIERLSQVDPEGAADEITKEYIEVTVADALADLSDPGAGDFFGRIDDEGDRWYIGRRHIEDGRHDPVVVDWRAPIAAPFYRATAVDSLGIAFRRRFTLDEGEITAYLDEHLDDPDEGEVAGGIPDAPFAIVDRDVGDGDEISLGSGAPAEVIHVPGHTAGSISVYVPKRGIVFTGDAAASMNGRPIVGVFNVDGEEAKQKYVDLVNRLKG